MNDLNQLALNGRLTRDAELKYANSGTAICNFSLASNRSVKKDGKYEDEANFFDCTLFGKSAENLCKYLVKGQQVSISGELRQERWEKDGEKKSRVSIIANNIFLIGGKKDETEKPKQDYYKPPVQKPVMDMGGPEDFEGDGIPF
jgi:single-strand DNA-binding protein